MAKEDNAKAQREDKSAVSAVEAVEAPQADVLEQTKRFAEIGRLSVDIARREARGKLFREALASFAAWLKAIETSDEAVFPLYLRSLIDVHEFTALARAVRSDNAQMEELKEKLARTIKATPQETL